MARIRSIHPGLCTDEAVMQLTLQEPLAVIFWMGLLMEADDNGVLEIKPLTLKARILPAPSVDVEALLVALESVNMLRRFSHSGRQYAAIRNFCRFQRPKKPKYVHPVPDDIGLYVAKFPTGSEPSNNEDGGGGELVGNQYGTGGEKSPQIGGGRREEKKELMLDRGSSECAQLPLEEDFRPPDPVRIVAARTRTKPADRAEPEGFAAFYQAYPRHDGRAKAAQAFPSAVLKAGGVEALMGHLACFRFPPDAKSFAPHPATWLNERRWLDGQGVEPAPAVSAELGYDARYFDLKPEAVVNLPEPRRGSAEFNAWMAALEGKSWPRPGSGSRM